MAGRCIHSYYRKSNDIGAYLIQHKEIKAAAFTGSFAGGKALFDLGSQRKEPIPVFAEMGSINPVFAFQNQLSVKAEQLAKEYAASLTLGVGQFCTNPGYSLPKLVIVLNVSKLHFGMKF